MATHDYIISNASGAAVRSDLNNALSAIVSNNSSATEPATTYAYQMWADTGSTPAVMKLRDSTNSSWITLYNLDGSSLPIASATEIVFNDAGADLDFRIEGDTDANLFYVDAGNDRIGVGTSSPSSLMQLQTTSANVELQMLEDNGSTVYGASIDAFNSSGGNIRLRLHDSGGTYQERLRIDSSGRLLVGTASNTAPGGNSSLAQIASTSFTAGLSIRRDSADTAGPALLLAKSRGSLNGNTVVQSGDSLGEIVWWGADGTDVNSIGAKIECAVDTTPGSNDMPGRLVFSTTADGATSPTENMRIDSSGNVGIGQTSVTQFGTAYRTVELKNTDGGAIRFMDGSSTANSNDSIVYHNSSGLYLRANSSRDINFWTNGSERLKIDASGNLLLADAADIKFLNSAGTSYSTGMEGSNDYLNVFTSDTVRMTLGPTGRFYLSSNWYTNVTTSNSANVHAVSSGEFYRFTSSLKYKTDVETIQDSYSDAILSIRPVWYRSLSENDNSDHSWWGFIAEEVAEVDPRLVQWKTIDVTYDENGYPVETPCDPEPEGVAYDRFVPHLLNLIKRQQQAIETLEAKVAALESA